MIFYKYLILTFFKILVGFVGILHSNDTAFQQKGSFCKQQMCYFQRVLNWKIKCRIEFEKINTVPNEMFGGGEICTGAATPRSDPVGFPIFNTHIYTYIYTVRVFLFAYLIIWLRLRRCDNQKLRWSHFNVLENCV